MNERFPHERLLQWMQSWAVDPIVVYGDNRGWRQFVFVVVCFLPAVIFSSSVLQRIGLALDSPVILGLHSEFWSVAFALWVATGILSIPVAWSGDTTWLEGIVSLAGHVVVAAVAIVVGGWIISFVVGMASGLLWAAAQSHIHEALTYPLVLATALGVAWVMYRILIPGAIHFLIEGIAASYHQQDVEEGMRFLETTARKRPKTRRISRCDAPISIESRSSYEDQQAAMRQHRAPNSRRSQRKQAMPHPNSRLSDVVPVEGMPPGMIEAMQLLIYTSERHGGGLLQIVEAYCARINAEARRRNYRKMTQLWQALREHADAFYDAYMSGQRVGRMKDAAELERKKLQVRLAKVEKQLDRLQNPESNVDYVKRTVRERKEAKLTNAQEKIQEAREWKRLRQSAKQEFEDDPEMLQRVLDEIDAVFRAGNA